MGRRVIFAALAAMPLLLVATVALPRHHKPPVCPGGTFVLAAPLSVGAAGTPVNAIVIQGREVGITGACPLVPGTVKATPAGTQVKAHWQRCGSLRNVHLAAVIHAGCTTISGMLSAHKLRTRHFAGGASSTTTSTSTTTTTTTTTPPLIRCCLPGSAGGAFTCTEEPASQCAAAKGVNMRAGACTPNPCAFSTTTTTNPKPCRTSGASCGTDSECCLRTCTAGICCQPHGSGCASDQDCCDGTCDGGSCGSTTTTSTTESSTTETSTTATTTTSSTTTTTLCPSFKGTLQWSLQQGTTTNDPDNITTIDVMDSATVKFTLVPAAIGSTAYNSSAGTVTWDVSEATTVTHPQSGMCPYSAGSGGSGSYPLNGLSLLWHVGPGFVPDPGRYGLYFGISPPSLCGSDPESCIYWQTNLCGQVTDGWIPFVMTSGLPGTAIWQSIPAASTITGTWTEPGVVDLLGIGTGATPTETVTWSFTCECPSDQVACGTTCCTGNLECTNPATSTCGCASDEVQCGTSCCPPGQSCDPVHGACLCPDGIPGCPPDSGVSVCCAAGEVCDGSICCATAQLCGEHCCQPGIACINNERCSFCDTANGQTECGTGCCLNGQVCVDPSQGSSGCCDAGTHTPCGTSCCPSPQTCQNDQCVCPSGGPYCGATAGCCQPGDTCVLAAGHFVCCPSGQACGSTCCATGQSCVSGSCM